MFQIVVIKRHARLDKKYSQKETDFKYSGKCPNRFGFTAPAKQSVFWTMVENSTKSLTCKIDSFYPYWRVISFLNGCLKVKNNYTKIKPLRLLW